MIITLITSFEVRSSFASRSFLRRYVCVSPDLVQEISDSRQENIRSKALLKAATAGSSTRGHPRRLVVNRVRRNISRRVVTRFNRPNNLARGCHLRMSMLQFRSIRSTLRRRGSTGASRIGDNHSGYCKGQDFFPAVERASQYVLSQLKRLKCSRELKPREAG